MWWKYILDIPNKHKILRGMVTYSALWPTGCLIQQYAEGKDFDNFNWRKCLRYSMYGALVSAPTLFCWMKVANKMWPRTDIYSSVCKALTEQIAYDPFAICAFLYVMSRFEGKTKFEAYEEMENKFFSVWSVGFIYWPICQTVNFSMVRPKYQIHTAGVFSLIWTTFLAYMKSLNNVHDDADADEELFA